MAQGWWRTTVGGVQQVPAILSVFVPQKFASSHTLSRSLNGSLEKLIEGELSVGVHTCPPRAGVLAVVFARHFCADLLPCVQS